MKIRQAIDPSQTVLLRRGFIANMNKRLDAVKKSIKDFFSGDVQNLSTMLDANKIEIFGDWLNSQIEEKVLSVGGVLNRKLWTHVYIENAYYKGMLRSYIEVNKKRTVFDSVNWLGGAKNQFLKDAMGTSKVLMQTELLRSRVTNLMKGLADDMRSKMIFALASGISKRQNDIKIQRNLRNVISKIIKNRGKILAATEIVHAQSEGQLDGFELLGVKEVQTIVESSLDTAHSKKPLCNCFDKSVYMVDDARGVIPFHPYCKCAWEMRYATNTNISKS